MEGLKNIGFLDAEFHKATMSTRFNNKCVEVAIREDIVGVRDSKDLKKTTLTFSRDEWEVFIQGVKNGEFDLKKSSPI